MNNTTNTTKIKKKKREKSADEEGLKIDAIENRVNNPLTGRSIVIPSPNTKAVEMVPQEEMAKPVEEPNMLKGRGRPKKIVEQLEEIEPEPEVITEKRGRGRPKKVVEQVARPVAEPVIEPEPQQEVAQVADNEEPVNLFDIVEEEEEKEEPVNLFGISEDTQEEEEIPSFRPTPSSYQNIREEQKQELERTNYYNTNSNFDGLISKDKKLVAFVGTTKNGTSFIVNNLAMLFSSMGINTAILDTTRNRNSYYIFTKNEEELRKK